MALKTCALSMLDNDVTNFKAKEAIAATDWARVVAIRVQFAPFHSGTDPDRGAEISVCR